MSDYALVQRKVERGWGRELIAMEALAFYADGKNDAGVRAARALKEMEEDRARGY